MRALAVVVTIWCVNGVYLSALSKHGALPFWGADLVQWVVVPTLLLWSLAQRHGVQPHHYGLNWADLNGKTLAWSVPASATLYAAYFGVTRGVSDALGQPSGFFAFQDVFPSGAMGTVVWLYSALSAGIVESVFFIGLPWLLWSQTRAGNPWAFAAVWSVIFATAHWEQGPHVFVGALAFGLVALAWFFRFHSLWPVLIGHVLVDLIDFG